MISLEAKFHFFSETMQLYAENFVILRAEIRYEYDTEV